MVEEKNTNTVAPGVSQTPEETKEPTQNDSAPTPTPSTTVSPSTTTAIREPSANKEKTSPEIPEGDSEKVTIERSVLEGILDKQKQQEEKIDMLTQVADKSRIFNYQEKNKGKLIHRAKVVTWLYENIQHYVVGWRMIKDEVGVDSNNVVKEIQIMRLFLKNKKEGEKPIEVDVNYVDVSRNAGLKEGDIISETRTNDGETRTLQFEDGEKLELDIRFLNL